MISLPEGFNLSLLFHDYCTFTSAFIIPAVIASGYCLISGIIKQAKKV